MTFLVRYSLLAVLILGSSVASGEIIGLDIRYEIVGGPNDGDVFRGMLEIDDTDPNFVPFGMIPWFNYKSDYSNVGDWDSNSDILQGGILLWLGADLENFTDAGVDGIVWDTVFPLATLENIVHYATGQTFAIFEDGGGNMLYEGTVTLTRKTPMGNISPFGKPGSVLVYPYVNSDAAKTLVTITNTNTDHTYCGGGIPEIYVGTVRVKLVFVFEEEDGSCSLQDEILILSPADTISFFADDLLEEDQEGWLIVAALSALDIDGETELIDFDHLIGSAQVYATAENYVWAYDAYAFRSVQEDGFDGFETCGHGLADLNGDDTIQFDNVEYDAFPLIELIPQIFQKGTGGGTHDDFDNFLAVMSTELTTDFEVKRLLLNNSEDPFSGSFDMRCFKAGPLFEEFNIADDTLLAGDLDPTDDPDEIPYSGFLILRATGRIDSVNTPAILSVFAQSANGQWWAGANNWRAPLIVENVLPRYAEFFMDL